MKGIGALTATIYKSELDEEPGKNKNRQLVRQRNENSKQLWLAMAENLIPLWSLIEQHHDFTEDDILSLHRRSNIFMEQWTTLYGTKHMTNYIHIIGSSHLTYFVQKYGNLYRYSQQGWEALNQMLKHYYFNNTNHGGSYGNGGKSEDGTYSRSVVCGDHCRPLMRLCQRTLMWKLGYGEAYFLRKEHSSMFQKSTYVGESRNTQATNETQQPDDCRMFGVI
jgi:hypothetical protein